MAKSNGTKAKKKRSPIISGNLISAILYIVIGICMLFGGTDGAIRVIAYIIGALFIIDGVLELILVNDFIGGIIAAVIGVAVIVLGAFVAKYFLYILGALLALYGIYHIIVGRKTTAALIINALMLVAGILLIIGNAVTGTIVQVFCIIAGVVLIIQGVLALLGKKML